MPINYPTSLDNFTNPTANDSLNIPSHSLQHSNANDAIEAIEDKLGIGAASAGSATSGAVLTAGTGGTTTWSRTIQNLLDPASAAWTSYTPVVTASGSNPTTSSATGSYTTIGKIVFWKARLTISGAGSGYYYVSLPVTCNQDASVGYGVLTDSSALAATTIVPSIDTGDRVALYFTYTGNYSIVTHAQPYLIASGDSIFLQGHYQRT